MASDKYFVYNGVELVNLSRTVQLAETLNINTLQTRASDVAWIETAIGGPGYGAVVNAPWYDAGYPASTEFAGIVPLRVAGLDDSSLESTPEEYITDGGNSGRPRNATLPVVWSAAIIASTERGAKFGKTWLDRVLRDSDSSRPFCTGADLSYFPSDGASATSMVHRRNVRLTRGTSITQKRAGVCAVTWFVTFTQTAADPYEYNLPSSQVTEMGGAVATGPAVGSQGTLDIEEESCPAYDYSPLYDPSFPALVSPPAPPNFLPEGWGIEEGMIFRRKWVRLDPFEPSAVDVVPVVELSTDTEARMVRFSIWAGDAIENDQCGALWTAIVMYLPEDLPMYLDGESQAAYVWDGFSPAVRRSDSLVYGTDAAPVQWASISDPLSGGLMATLDIFATEDGWQGDEDVRASLKFVTKTD